MGQGDGTKRSLSFVEGSFQNSEKKVMLVTMLFLESSPSHVDAWLSTQMDLASSVEDFPRIFNTVALHVLGILHNKIGSTLKNRKYLLRYTKLNR